MSGNQSVYVRNEWLAKAKYSFRIEHCLGFEKNDDGIRSAYGLQYDLNQGESPDKKTKFIVTESLTTPSAVRNWNSAARISTGEFILLIADDLVPDLEWDVKIDNFITSNNLKDGIFKFTDDRCSSLFNLPNDTLLPRHPGLLRSTYNSLGYMFNPVFNSTGPDLDLLIYALNNGCLRDARSIKFHHSVGPIFDQKLKLICGCYADKQVISNRTTAQNRMHSQETNDTKSLLKKNWSRDSLLLANLACINRLSNSVMSSLKANKKNYPLLLITKSLIKYYLYKFIRPSLGSRSITYFNR